jgi:hypothetical protein
MCGNINYAADIAGVDLSPLLRGFVRGDSVPLDAHMAEATITSLELGEALLNQHINVVQFRNPSGDFTVHYAPDLKNLPLRVTIRRAWDAPLGRSQIWQQARQQQGDYLPSGTPPSASDTKTVYEEEWNAVEIAQSAEGPVVVAAEFASVIRTASKDLPGLRALVRRVSHDPAATAMDREEWLKQVPEGTQVSVWAGTDFDGLDRTWSNGTEKVRINAEGLSKLDAGIQKAVDLRADQPVAQATGDSSATVKLMLAGAAALLAVGVTIIVVMKRRLAVSHAKSSE